MDTLAGKTAIITGASRGIGRAIAVKLSQEGAQVVLTARDQTALETAVTDIRDSGGKAQAIALDLSLETSPEQLVAFAVDQFGGVDIVVNNAGATKRGEFLELTEQDWQEGFGLKFFGAVRLSRAAWPQLAARSGSLLSIAGVGGRTPGAAFTIGGSVNAALLSLTKALADAGIRDGVQVNAVNPGPVRTDRLAKRLAAQAQGTDMATASERFVREAGITRIGEPEDIANLAAFIVSPAGRFLQGALIDMDGGQTKTI